MEDRHVRKRGEIYVNKVNREYSTYSDFVTVRSPGKYVAATLFGEGVIGDEVDAKGAAVGEGVGAKGAAVGEEVGAAIGEGVGAGGGWQPLLGPPPNQMQPAFLH